LGVPLPFCQVGSGFINLVNLFKEATFCFIDSLHSLFGFDFINLGPDLYYFSPSSGFGFDLFLFFLGA
jgi:hypothetical protein